MEVMTVPVNLGSADYTVRAGGSKETPLTGVENSPSRNRKGYEFNPEYGPDQERAQCARQSLAQLAQQKSNLTFCALSIGR